MEAEVRQLLDKQDWDTVIKKLTLHAYSRFKFWNLLKQRAIKGYSPEEVALEAISLVYSGEWRWDPTKSELLTYLKFHVVNGIVANLARNKEVLTTDTGTDFEPSVDFNVEDDLNAQMVIAGIREVLKEELLIKIYDKLLLGLRRAEIIDQIGIAPSDYDNGLKRLKAKILKWKQMTISK